MKLILKFILFSIFFWQFSVSAQNSPNLDDYILLANKNSPLLNDYNNQKYSLQIDSLKFKADNGFKINGLSDASYSPLIAGWGYNGSVAAGRNLAAIIRVSRDILSKKNRSAKYRNFSLSIQQILNQSSITTTQINKAIAEQYIITYAAQQKYLVTQEIVTLLEKEDLILKTLAQKTVFKQTDYLSFKVTLQQNILAMEQQHAEWLNNFAGLNYLAGKIDESLPTLAAPNLSLHFTSDYNNSIYAESYKTDSLKILNEADIINYEYQPKLSVYADGGYSSALISAPYKNFGASVGLSLNIPIYDGHKKKLSLQQNKLSQNTLEEYNQFRKSQFQIQVKQLQNQIKEYQQIIQTANEQMYYAKTLVEANLKQLPTGDIHIADFILSINNYINLKSGMVNYEATLSNLYNHLQNITLP